MQTSFPVKSMVRFFRAFVIVAAFGAVLFAPAQVSSQSQEPQDIDVLRVNTNLVTVPVNVMDRQGRFIPDLRREQFHLYEDGVEQDIAFFENAEKPFTVALLLDTSDSTKFRLNEIQEAALAFIEQLHPDDRVMVATFDKQVRILSELSSDHRSLHEQLLSREAELGRWWRTGSADRGPSKIGPDGGVFRAPGHVY